MGKNLNKVSAETVFFSFAATILEPSVDCSSAQCYCCAWERSVGLPEKRQVIREDAIMKQPRFTVIYVKVSLLMVKKYST